MNLDLKREDDGLVLSVPDGGMDPAGATKALDGLSLPDTDGISRLRIEAPENWKWGTGDAAFLAALLQRLPKKDGDPVALEGVPKDLAKLLELARTAPAAKEAPQKPTGLRKHLGLWALGEWAEIRAMLTLIGEVVLRLPRFLTGRAMVRRNEVIDVLAESSVRALAIVGIVNLLMGSILAFVGAVQLKAFGAGLYVADLVGIASVRELAPVMTAIVLAGRTGASFAARIATMQGNEEIDALTTLGVPPEEFLVLPRVVALSLLMPLLYVYACALSLIGGLLVATTMMDLTATAYMVETQGAIKSANFVIGGLKAFVFGAMVALIGCRCGLRAGRSAADVGQATTAAVVNAIVAIIAVDALFAVCANALGV
ncbi:MlaE family ABC transporter permease [Niveispirillum irakense]|uniref:MlaE family ABC transporter permease n=1 Tax=Niveispirillum irakense TaxID=34011 RepID=UPI00041FDCB4|nr:ABC transporter permease [Niveispirillum irakense]